MAVKPTTQLSASEQLAAYRAAARQLAPTIPSEETTLAITIGKKAAAGRSFFTNVVAVYKVERSKY